MLIYSEKQSPRLSYVIDFISAELLTSPAAITTDREVFRHFEGVKINYANESFEEGCFRISPTPILFETGIRDFPITCFELGGHKAFFATGSDDLGFDIFAAIFYLVSRYEEYLPHQKDEYGRYSHTASLAFREGFLDQPLVNNWLEYFREKLQERFPAAIFRRKNFSFVPTYDIDMMYAYKAKGWKRNAGGLVRSILNGEWASAAERISVLRGKARDPYDAYEWLDALHLYCRVKPVYFFLVAQQQDGVDKNIPTSVKAFQQLINYYASAFEVGLHPSWRSSVSADDKIMLEEKEWMEVIADVPVVQSRQHYIKFSLPEGYERLIRCGIRKDYSMGYGTINGFRASVASPFFWFSLAENKVTNLQVYPFCFMDANAYYEQKLNPQQAYTELMKYYAAVKKVRGCFITIWHNNFLGTDPGLKGWRDLYEIFMKEDAYWDAGA
ncbi:DUF7033 domain-containing protein [Flavihumibacter stibioxidans]|uniref:DUF7033 domain-containing protein n=1 Tax=Flavihumibacter stibioxidans TaxID=1834163 RepID=A0ABR7M9E5_9BACT|nr:hypothetical protein [Flavihumibacter stibioxidans]MBC6491641.1 hypothetical protein [Flavihumibacter stibioxidans]